MYYFVFLALVLCLIFLLLALSIDERFPDRFHTSSTTLFDCNFGGSPICCAALEPHIQSAPKKVRRKKSMFEARHYKKKCTTTRRYIPSSYETHQYETAVTINKLPEESKRRDAYIKYFLSSKDIKDSKKWLERVNVHSSSDEVTITATDYEYMSRFEVNRTCTYHTTGGVAGHESIITTEWIEPISMHARHPFSYYHCGHLNNTYEMDKLYAAHKLTHTPLTSSDYILVQSGKETNNDFIQKSRKSPTKHYLLDIGTSSFETSLYYFICSYLQVRLTLVC